MTPYVLYIVHKFKAIKYVIFMGHIFNTDITKHNTCRHCMYMYVGIYIHLVHSFMYIVPLIRVPCWLQNQSVHFQKTSII